MKLLRLSFIKQAMLACLIIAHGWAFGYSKEDSLEIVSFFESLENDSLIAEQKINTYESELRLVNEVDLVDLFLFSKARHYFSNYNMSGARIAVNEGFQLFPAHLFPKEKAKYHNLIGSIELLQGNEREGIKNFIISARILDFYGDAYNAALVKNNIANIFFGLHDFDLTRKYAQESYEVLRLHKDTLYLPVIGSVLAVSEIKLGDTIRGLQHLEESLELSDRLNHAMGKVVGLYGQGELSLAKNDYNAAKMNFFKSLEIASTNRLYHFILLDQTALANLYLQEENYDSTVYYGEMALYLSELTKNKNIEYALHKYLGYAYGGNNNFEKGLFHMTIAHEDYLESNSEKNKILMDEMLVKYETEKKEKEILNQKLTISQQEKSIYETNFILTILVAILLLLMLVFFIYRKMAREKLVQIQHQRRIGILNAISKGEEQERIRLANEIHDGIASAITGIKFRLENELGTKTESHSLLEQLDDIYLETRRISHNLSPGKLEELGWNKAIENFAIENTSSNFKIHFLQSEFDYGFLSNEASLLVYRSIQELVHNARKHGKAKQCFITLSLQDKNLVIQVEDDGVGFDSTTLVFGQGLSAIRKRIELLGGSMEIDAQPEQGCTVILYLNEKNNHSR
ncbi:MAG: ATP-binding protein [Crocinitomicaceae bacterium]